MNIEAVDDMVADLLNALAIAGRGRAVRTA
jgi:hypothetical protein